MLDKLSESLKKTIRSIATSFSAEKELIDAAVKEIQRALIQADVNIKLVLELSKRIKKRAFEEKPKKGISRKEQVINIIYEELVNILGKDEKLKLEIPAKILLVGLFGNGKTTTAAKLAYYYKKRGYKVGLIQLDTFRAAAYEQLQQLANQIHVDFFGDKKEKNPVKVWKEFEEKLKNYDIVIVDTAGRDALEESYVDEIKQIHDAVKPQHTLLVISADIGQQAESQAKAFHEALGITGVIVTKLDGSARGGGALSACALANVPVYFIGTGEKINEFEEFNVKGFVGRLIGFGDLEALLKKIHEEVPQDYAKSMEEKIARGEFDLIDLYMQLETMTKFGSLSKILSMIPGLSGLSIPKEMLNVQEEMLKKWKIAMQSFTFKELKNPEIVDESRIERISKGSGIDKESIKLLLKQYRQMKKLFKAFGSNKGRLKSMLKKYKKMGIDLDKLDLNNLNNLDPKMFGM